MTGGGKLIMVGCVIGLAVGLLACAPSAQAQTAAAAQPSSGEPSGVDEVWARADALCEQSKFAEARAICQEGYDSATDDESRAFFLRRLGTISERSAQFDQAIETFNQVITQFAHTTQVPWAKLNLATTYIGKARLKMGDPKDNATSARQLLEQFLKDYPNHDGVAGAIELLGQSYELLGDERAALMEYLKGVDLHPDYPEADKLITRAIALEQKLGGWEDPIAALESLINDESRSAKARGTMRFILANRQLRAGRPAEAAKTLEWLEANQPELLANPEFKRAFELARVETFVATGDSAGAQRPLQTLLVYHPGTREACLGLMKVAALYENDEQYRSASRFYRWVAEDGRFEASWRSQAYVRLAELYLVHLGDQAQATSCFETAVQLMSGSATAP